MADIQTLTTWRGRYRVTFTYEKGDSPLLHGVSVTKEPLLPWGKSRPVGALNVYTPGGSVQELEAIGWYYISLIVKSHQEKAFWRGG